MSSALLFNDKAREKLQVGVNKVANAVKVTLGAKGRNVSISRGAGHLPLITKDGVTVANYITKLADPVEDMGAMMVKDAARQTMRLVGDGTTTSTVLAQSIFNEGIKSILAGNNPMDLKKGIDRAVSLVISHLKKQAKSIDGDKDKILQIATIAANNDPDMGAIIAEAMAAAGKDGYVSICETKSAETSIEKVEGMEVERGYLSEYMCNNAEKKRVELENPYILIYDKKISRLPDIRVFLEKASAEKRSVLIIAEDIEGEAAFTVTSNAVKGAKWAAIRSPFGGTEELEDIAAITGATVVSESKGHTLRDFNAKWVGTAKTVTITQSTTIIAGGGGDKKNISDRNSQLNTQIEDCTDDRMKGHLVKRLGKLSNGVVVIYVGGQTEVEMKEKRDRIDDAIKATKAAIEEGVLPGGGISYLHAMDSILEWLPSYEAIWNENKETAGILVLTQALKYPYTQIMVNAGYDTLKIEDHSKHIYPLGFNVKTEKVEDFLQAGIIDPAKVTRIALENAASVASMLLTTECTISDE